MIINSGNRVAVITGASRGIGREIALTLAKGKTIVVVNYLSNSPSDEEDAKEVVATIHAMGSDAIAIGADVSKSNEIESMVSKIIDIYKRIDILVNNSGISLHKLMVDTSEEEWNMVLNVNLTGCFLCTKFIAQRMISQGKGGRIINISSQVATQVIRERCAYSSSKAAIEAFTKCCALELGPYGITANAVAPGPTKTGINPLFSDDLFVSQITKSIPLGKIADPTEIASVVKFLASEEASHINGGVIHVDGGESVGKFALI